MVQIIDASLAIKWFVRESGQETALEILEQILESPDQFAVPELFYFELAHVLNRLVPSLSEGQCRLFEQLLTLGIPRFSMTDQLYREIGTLQHLGLSGYDAAYVALAKILRGTWLSFDKKAHERVVHLHLSRLLK